MLTEQCLAEGGPSFSNVSFKVRKSLEAPVHLASRLIC